MRLLSVFVIIFIHFHSSGQPSLIWEKTYGGSGYDAFSSILKTTDGGFLTTGQTESNDGDVSINNGGKDSWLVKLSADGDIEWEFSLGDSLLDLTFSTIETIDGSFISVGMKSYEENDNFLSYYWIYKVNSNGELQWEKMLEGNRISKATNIIRQSDGNYLVVGITGYSDSDILLMKITDQGQELWKKEYGGNKDENVYAIVESFDSGIVIAASSYSDNVTFESDYLITKLSSSGHTEWSYTYGGDSFDVPYSIIKNSNGGFTIIGGTYSESVNDLMDVNKGKSDFWIAEIDTDGSLLNSRLIGGTLFDIGKAIIQNSDGTYLVCGSTESSDFDASYNNGGRDIWLLKLTEEFDVLWEATYGGSRNEAVGSIELINENELFISGLTNSSDFDISNNKGSGDGWLLKLSLDGSSSLSKVTDTTFTIFPNPVRNIINIEAKDQPTIQIVNQNGSILGSYNTSTIDFSYFNTGVYYLQILGSDQNTVKLKRIVKIE